jgi:ribose 5-phosphate isomerase A
MPRSFTTNHFYRTDVIKNLAMQVVKQHFSTDSDQVVGLGSGSTVAAIVKEMGNISSKRRLECIVTSLQIKRQVEESGLKIVGENRIPSVDIVLDGADQIDSEFAMIKGGGGALLKEKVLINASKKIVIAADSNKFTNILNIPVPIEVHPFARSFVGTKLKKEGGNPVLRTIKKNYPFITENGNIIFDTAFNSLTNLRKKESELKSIPGVLEVGIFTRRADIYYKAKNGGSLEIIEF